MKGFAVMFTPEAESDALESYSWYENQRKGLGEVFKISLNLKIESLSNNPEASSYIHKNIRSSKLKKFPFSIIYRISNSQLQILAIFHHSRNPTEWKKRI